MTAETLKWRCRWSAGKRAIRAEPVPELFDELGKDVVCFRCSLCGRLVDPYSPLHELVVPSVNPN